MERLCATMALALPFHAPIDADPIGKLGLGEAHSLPGLGHARAEIRSRII